MKKATTQRNANEKKKERKKKYLPFLHSDYFFVYFLLLFVTFFRMKISFGVK
jgi:hypothetical protein